LNGTGQPGSIARCSKKPFFFLRRCGRCLVRLTAEGANKWDSFQHCIYHSEGQQQAEPADNDSRFNRTAQEVLRELAFLPPCAALLATESKFLGGTFGALDFSLPVQTPRACAGCMRRWTAKPTSQIRDRAAQWGSSVIETGGKTRPHGSSSSACWCGF
jgi:hypothetical protein